MKRIIILLMICCIFVSGCGKYSEKNIIKDFNKKISNGYKLSGELDVLNNDEVYHYNVSVSHIDDYYKVTLVNQANNHKQVILKNDDGVYVLTPSLNKSFRFQSDWPYNNSQIYLLDRIYSDIEKDNKREFKKNNNYIITTSVNYPNNNKLKKQKIIFDKKLKVKKISVFDKDGIEAMTFSIDSIKYSPKINKDEFKIDNIIKGDNKEVKETSSIDDVIYPLVLPSGTKLVGEEKISKDNGERIIMSYDGEKSFLLVEETTDVFNDFTIIPTSGEPYQLMDTLGVMTTNSLSWTSDGIDYYIVSDVMSQDEMIEVAQSINGTISMK